jgi:hypothetical protein
VQAFPALLVHRAVAVAPTARQLTARFSRSSGVGEAIAMPAKAKSRAVEKNMMNNDDMRRECFLIVPTVSYVKLLYIAIDQARSMNRQ